MDNNWLPFLVSFLFVPLSIGVGIGTIRYAGNRLSGCKKCADSDRYISQLEEAYNAATFDQQLAQPDFLDRYFELIVLFEVSAVLLLLVCTLLVLVRFTSVMEKKLLADSSSLKKPGDA